jgi:hypothetical protein
MSNQWTRIAEKNKERMRKVAAKSFIVATTSVTKMSPVDTGRFRGNWMYGLNNPDLSTLETGVQFSMNESGLHFNNGDTLYFTNNLPYAKRLEYGWSKQAPKGMVRLTAAKWPYIVEQVTRLVK